MGKTCEPKAFSFQCMTKFTTNKKKKERKKTIRGANGQSNEQQEFGVRDCSITFLPCDSASLSLSLLTYKVEIFTF